MKTIFFFLSFFALTAAQAQNFKLEGNALQLPGPILFETGSDKIKPESKAILTIVKEYLEAKTYISLLRIENHTDSNGDEAANQALSEKRALAISKWLVENGVDCRRLIAVGFGGSKPVADNATPEGRSENRRSVFANAALRDRLIGGMPADGGGNPAGDPCK